jgi:hypothetical protein
VIERVAIDGVDLALGDVFAAVTIRHGRGSVDDGPLGSTATLSLVGVDRAFTSAFVVGATLELDTTGAVPRFRGRITDANLNTSDPDESALSILAVSSLARISGRKIGAGAWPSEPWSDRVERAFTEAGELALLVLEVGAQDPTLAARAAEETTLADVLSTLAQTNPAAIADLPNGDILVQAVDSRQGADPIELDPLLVVHAPEWTQTDDVQNVVRVAWDGGEVEQQDAASIAAFEERAPLTLTTELTTSDAANARAIRELTRRSTPLWTVERAELLELDTTLAIGSPILIGELPAAAPAESVLALLEGWEDHVEGDEWSMLLSLSHQRLSGYGLAWEDVPATVSWDEAGATTWNDPDPLLTI